MTKQTSWLKGKKGYTNKGSFKKGHHSKAEFKKGQHCSPATEFKKGMIPWSKGKKCPQLSGKNNPHWKGGKLLRKDGYMFIYSVNHPFASATGYVLEHRLIVEKQIGRYLTKNEVVHHVNEIKNDNRPKNLMAFVSNPAHKRFHHNPDNVKPKEIIFDGRNL